MAKTRENIDETKRLMGALIRMKPKPHEDMKIRAPSRKRTKRKKKV